MKECSLWKKYGKTLNGYEGLYQISNLGRVKSLERDVAWINGTRHIDERILIPSIGHFYYMVSLCKNGVQKSFKIHRLVAETFIPNPNNFPQVNHKDENQLNNRVDNLEWCTQKYNNIYGTRLKRCGVSKRRPVKCIETGIIYSGACEAGRKTNAISSHITMVCKKKRHTAGGYHWEYAKK